MFLINAKRIRSMNSQLIFSEENKETLRKFPSYSGMCFETSLNSYMRNHGLKRITYKKSFYMHEDF